MICKRIFLLCLLIISGLSGKTQTSGLQEIIADMDTLRNRMPAEKLYIQFDKPYYITGDTIRMKAYLFDAAMLKRSDKSGIVYVELANDTNKIFFKRMLPVGYGLGTGNIILNKEDIPEGSYTITAYTNLMRNFGEDLVFRKNFYIGGSSVQNWLVNIQTILSKQGGRDNLRLALEIREFNKKALATREFDMRIIDGKKVVQRDKVNTDISGNLDVNFNLPEKMDGDLSIRLTDVKDTHHTLTIPLSVNRNENIDLQFMPEGGNLVAGIPGVVGFKAIAEDGKGTDVKGKIYNASNQEVVAFNSSHKGMGSFEFTPKAGETYTAKIDLDNTTKIFTMPASQNNGTGLRLTNISNSDSIEVVVSGTTAAAYFLTAQSRGIICYGAIVRLNGNNMNTRKVAKSLFPTGIVRFTLMTVDKKPLNERITFVNHHDNLAIEIIPSNTAFQTRDSIALSIEVKDQDGKPIEGSFSLAVTDDGQIKTDSLSSNLLSSLLLTSDLKGNVEDPGHYLQPTKEAEKDLDNLLLTQGWTGYDWKDVFNPPANITFKPEPAFLVTGKVTNVFNKGSAVTGIQLFSLNPSFVQISVTENDGSFKFSDLPVEENMKYFIQAKNKRDKSFNVGIQLNEVAAAEFKMPNHRYLPWFVNSDSILLQQATTSVLQEASLNAKGGNLLAEVTIKAKKVVNDSKNLNGAGEADQILDLKDIAVRPKRTLLNVMEERVRGFNVGLWPSANSPAAGINNISSVPIPAVSGPGGMGTESRTLLGTTPYYFEKTTSYRINDKEMHLVIDGVDVESLYNPTYGFPFPTTNAQLALQRKVDPGGNYILERNAASPDDRQRFIKTYLDYILAEDVKGIEVMTDPKFSAAYKSKFATGAIQSLSVAGADFAYVEVTTFSGNGAYLKGRPGTYLYRPIPYVNSTAYYRPKYLVKTSPISDFRSTVHWEPDIVTNKDGKATVSFYAADRAGSYSIIMEGSDMNGNIGRKTGKLTIRY